MDIQLQLIYHQYKILNLEEGNWNKLKAITITPVGKNVTMATMIERYKQLITIKSIQSMVVIEEISDQGMNHLHGIANVFNNYKFRSPKNMVILVKQLKYMPGWATYCNKKKPHFLHIITKNTYYKYKLYNKTIQYCPSLIERKATIFPVPL